MSVTAKYAAASIAPLFRDQINNAPLADAMRRLACTPSELKLARESHSDWGENEITNLCD